MQPEDIELNKVSDHLWRVPKSGGMRVPADFYTSDNFISTLRNDQSLVQTVNVAHLPGIVKASMAMPDMHTGYGFPIGGVAAVDPEDGGVISPGGIGYDINCGVRVLTTSLTEEDVVKR